MGIANKNVQTMNEMFALRVNIIFLFQWRFVYVQKERKRAIWASACEHKKQCFKNTWPVRGLFWHFAICYLLSAASKKEKCISGRRLCDMPT